MQTTPTQAASIDHPSRSFSDPRLLLRGIYVGRLCVASAIFIAALFAWTVPDPQVPQKTLIASLAFVLATVLTVVSAGYSEVYRKPLGSTFFYLQSLFDLALVTAVVHLTSVRASVDGDTPATLSQFAPLYILIIVTASLLLPRGGSLLIATLGNLLYLADTGYVLHDLPGLVLWLQLVLFAIVALVGVYVGAELRQSGEATRMLRVEHERVRLHGDEILRNIMSGVVTVDEHGRLVYANPMAESLLGFGLSRLLGQPVAAELAARAPRLAEALQSAATERTRTQRVEGTMRVAGRDVPIGVTTTYMEDAATGVRTAIAIFQDISDNKRLETMRLRAERLEGIAELSASLAHEIKNPLASIRSSVEQLSRMPQATADGRTLSELVMRESDRLSRLLSEFLDFARVRVAQSRPVNLVDVVQTAARLAAVHPDRGEGVRLTVLVPVDGAVTIDGDDDLLHRAVFNLVLNALQAAPPDSEVTIELHRDAPEDVRPDTFARGQAVAFRVTDHGAGIPAEMRARLFDPFVTTKPQGSGLGLAIVHRAVEAHRGQVAVDSRAGYTRFTVVLPRHAATAETSA